MTDQETDAPVGTQRNTSSGSSARELLSILSRCIALAVLIIYFPALVSLGLLVIVTSHGPAFVRRAYRRKDTQIVYLYEYRTECWSTWEETGVGALLRETQLHRLPRLWNVLLGEVHAGERVVPHSNCS